MKKIVTIITGIFILSVSHVLAQADFRNGFIITIQNDTIAGQVDYRSNVKNYQSCRFKKDHQTTEFTSSQLRGYGFYHDKFFISGIAEDSFVEVLVEGELSLYKYKDFFFVKKAEEVYKLKTENIKEEFQGKLITKENNQWRGILSYLIFDCNMSQSQIKTLRFAERSLTKIVISYNICRNEAFTVYKESKPWTQVDVGVVAGITQSTVNIRHVEDARKIKYLDNTYHSMDPSVGLLLGISSPRITEKVVLQPELHFLTSSFSSLVVISEPYTEYYDTYIDLTTISLPLSIKYLLWKRKFPFYLQAGLNYDFIAKANSKVISESVINHTVSTTQGSAFEVNKKQLGYWGGIGISKAFRYFNGSAAVRYFQQTHLNATQGFSANYYRLSLSIILSRK